MVLIMLLCIVFVFCVYVLIFCKLIFFFFKVLVGGYDEYGEEEVVFGEGLIDE